MRRPILLTIAPERAARGWGLVGTATAATPSKYTTTRNLGPYNGGRRTPRDLAISGRIAEAKTVSCNPGNTILSGSAKINRKTSYGTARAECG